MTVIDESCLQEPYRSFYAALRTGQFQEFAKSGPTAQAAVYECVSAFVFDHHTRKLERRKGHPGCAVSIRHLEPDCHDAYQDDVHAVIDDVLRNAKVPFNNPHGWLATRITPATVDAHRRRRGARGAQQRPRLPLPGWLDDGLGGDPWLRALAVRILEWVGVPTSAPHDLWPLTAWAGRRAAATGETGCSEARVAADVELVLAAMRHNGPWYERYVAGPLARKNPPLAPFDTDPAYEHGYLQLVERHEIDDAFLLGLAGDAIAEIEVRVQAGEDLRSVSVEVIGVLLGSGTGTQDIDRAPGETPDDDERVALLLADPAVVDRIVDTIVDIFRTDRRR